MSTDFVLYSLPDDAVADAKRYAGTSLGYGNESMVAVLNNAALADRGGDRFAIFMRDDVGRFKVEEHVTFHDDEPCLPHDIVDVVGHDCPVIDDALVARVRALAPANAELATFLEEARGHRLWYVFE